MQSVSSNAVAECLRYTTTERIVGYWVDGRPIYRKVFKFTAQNDQTTFYNLPYTDNIIRAYLCVPENSYVSCSPYVKSDKTRGQSDYRVRCTWCNDTNWVSSVGFIYFEHTKASDLV